MNLELNFEKRFRLVREIIETVVLTVLMFLVINLAVQNFDVDGHSMESRLHDQERVMVDKASYLFHAPARGDVVVFVAPPQPSLDYVKRIIAIPGDVISVNDGVPTVDGVTLKEFYLNPHNVGASPTDKAVRNLTIPRGYYFVMGDNRIGSFDSRSWGLVPQKNIIGRAALVYWPLGQDNNGLLPDVSSVFANVHPRS
jgi:signal peptidase I